MDDSTKEKWTTTNTVDAIFEFGTIITPYIQKLGNRNNHDLGKGVMIQLGYIPYIST